MLTTTKKLYSFEEYLQYNDGTDSKHELINGEIIIMPPATGKHADIIDFLQDIFKIEIKKLNLSWVVRPRTVGVRTNINKSRIPDLMIITELQKQAIKNKSAVLETPPILVVEIVSINAEDDYRYKRSEYAAIEIPEYWIVDPHANKVTILTLENGFYEPI
jgi:Uma2 family endonuclease